MKKIRQKIGLFKKEIHKKASPFLLGVLIRIQKSLRIFAGYLQVKMAQCSLRTQKIWLVSFCLVFITASVLITVDSIRNKPKNDYKAKPIKFVPLVEDTSIQPRVSMEELSRIHHFKIYLDSLNQKSKDSFLAQHPHLIDTLNFLETLYQNQIKTR